MNHLTKLPPLLLSSALIAVAAQPGLAANTSITAIRVNSAPNGLELVFDTQGDGNTDVFTVSQGNTLRADLTRAQLNLPNGNSFQQANPAPGIAAISVVPLDANSVRVTISGAGQTPTANVASSSNQVVISVRSDGQVAQAPTPVPEDIVTVPAPTAPLE
ncbi:MAG TPA: AMIN domain-containing protein, partial [Leptolyngbyaceae cyanobacterium M65_K2018_010]|nr:AMIN domain-containing protein [Leptolyngbyaceae cyanobacterium M65_K2018_010]